MKHYRWNETGDEISPVFGDISGNHLYLKLQENVQRHERTVKYLQLLVFVHKKLKLLDFLSDFALYTI